MTGNANFEWLFYMEAFLNYPHLLQVLLTSIQGVETTSLDNED